MARLACFVLLGSLALALAACGPSGRGGVINGCGQGCPAGTTCKDVAGGKTCVPNADGGGGTDLCGNGCPAGTTCGAVPGGRACLPITDGGVPGGRDLAMPRFNCGDQDCQPDEMCVDMNGVKTCVPAAAGRNTGEACDRPGDCAKGIGPNQNPQCLKNVGMPPDNVMYPGGYCTTPCRMARNDPGTGLNTDCPGGESTCVGEAATGLCFRSCQLAADCNRAGYACGFVGGETGTCVPEGECSQQRPCRDPSKSCVFYSPDNSYGQCEAKCDVFRQDCAPLPQGTVMCLADPNNGQQNCVASVNPLNRDGAACRFLNDCAPGLSCRNQNGQGVCRPYCGGPNNVACNNGRLCVDLSQMVRKNVVGICGG